MNDDPTQTFPETHWKRYATEAVCAPVREIGGLKKIAAPSDQMTPPMPSRDVQIGAKVATRPMLS